MVYTCNSNSWETEAGELLQVEEQQGLYFKTIYKNKSKKRKDFFFTGYNYDCIYLNVALIFKTEIFLVF